MSKRLLLIYLLEAGAVALILALADVSFITAVVSVTLGYCIGALHMCLVDDGRFE